jgi:hypothetical protein
VGPDDGKIDGLGEGPDDGIIVGLAVGVLVGPPDGNVDGMGVGTGADGSDGEVVGAIVLLIMEGNAVVAMVGVSVAVDPTLST